MPLIPYGSKYTSRVSGATWKQVICQNCGTDFVYKLTRSAEGSGSSILWLNEDGAKLKARSLAYSRLNDKMDEDFDVIPCPTCGFYQDNMMQVVISTMRSKKTNSALVFALLIWGVTLGGLRYLGVNLWTSALVGFILAIFIFLIVNSNKTVEDPNLNAYTRVHQPYSEHYPVMLTALLVQLIEEEKQVNKQKST